MYNNQQTISVTVDRKKEEGKEEQAIVSVKDTGHGISRDIT